MFSRRNNEVRLPSLKVANDVVLPPTLFGNADEQTRERIQAFYCSAHDFLERWVARSQSKHTQLAYRNSIMQFVRFMEWKWPEESYRFFTVTIVEVTEWRDRSNASGASST
jgi:site-specific recombinase XerD